jgi:hypothetical protein
MNLETKYKWAWPTKRKGIDKVQVTLNIDKDFKEALVAFTEAETIRTGKYLSMATVFTTLALRHIKEVKYLTKQLNKEQNNEINYTEKAVAQAVKNI